MPQGATILAAHIEFTPEESSDDPANFTFHGENVDNAVAFKAERHNITNRKQTAAEVKWQNVPAWVKNQRHWSVSLSPIVQEIVNRSSWAEKNAMAFVIDGDGQRSAWSFNGKPGDAPMLYIEYSLNGEVSSSSVALEGDTTLRNTVSSTVLRGTDRGTEQLENDDAEEENEVDGSNQPGTNVKVYLPITAK